MKPYIIIPIGTFIPKRFVAFVFGFIIFVRPSHRNNVALIEHEKVHVHQFWRTFCTHGIWYQFNKGYRLRSEVEAYAVQIRMRRILGQPEDIERYAGYVSDLYNLDITTDEVVKLLKEELSD